MSQYRETTRRFAALLEPGDLVLSTRDLRELYGIGRVTAKARWDRSVRNLPACASDPSC